MVSKAKAEVVNKPAMDLSNNFGSTKLHGLSQVYVEKKIFIWLLREFTRIYASLNEDCDMQKFTRM